MKQYQNLNALLQADAKAASLFAQLPLYAKDQIRTRSDHVNSMRELEAYVNNVLRGDG